MKKILVVLLVLAIAGGASAQWSTWSGSGSLSTTIDLAKFNPVTIDGGVDISFGLRWDLEKNNWTVAMPFKITGDDGVELTGASVGYSNGPLTVKVPFALGITFEDMAGRGNMNMGAANNPNNPWYQSLLGLFEDMNIEASYERDNFGFGFGMNSIFGKFEDSAFIDDAVIYVDGIADIPVGVPPLNKVVIPGSAQTYTAPTDLKAWGWYDLAGGRIRMAVSYGGGYATEWWRASTIVLQGHADFWDPDTSVGFRRGWAMDGVYLDTNDDDEFFTETGFDLTWGNIADTGFAMRFNITPTFNLGFSFAGTKMFEGTSGAVDPTAPNPDYTWEWTDPTDHTQGGTWVAKVDASSYHFVDDFLKYFLFGLGFDNDRFAVSAMFGLKPAVGGIDIMTHAGFAFNINNNMSLNADVSLVTFGKFNAASLNVGAAFDMKTNFGLFGNIKIAATDLLNKFEGALAGTVDPSTRFIVGEDGYILDTATAATDAPTHGLTAEYNQGLQLGLGFQIGYGIDLTDKLNLTVTAGLAMAYGKLTDGLERLYFQLQPVFTWNLIENGSIVFDYTIGYETVSTDFTNKLGVSFKWSF